MTEAPMIILEKSVQMTGQTGRVKHDHVVQALAANRAHRTTLYALSHRPFRIFVGTIRFWLVRVQVTALRLLFHKPGDVLFVDDESAGIDRTREPGKGILCK